MISNLEPPPSVVSVFNGTWISWIHRLYAYVREMAVSNYDLNVARGLVTGVTSVNKFGRSGTNPTNDDVWSRSATTAIWVAPTAARAHTIASTSANDTTGGTGARTVRVWGLRSWTTAEVSEDVIMDTGAPPTTGDFVIIHRMKVLTSGSSNINVGTITATAAAPDSTVTAEIAVGQGQTQMAIYGVPSIQSFYCTRFYAYGNSGTATHVCDLSLRVNEDPNVQTTNFINKYDMQLAMSGMSGQDVYMDLPTKFAGPCIIKIRAVGSIADISAGFDGYLINN